MLNRCRTLAAASLVALATAPSQALVIDNFEEGTVLPVIDTGLNDFLNTIPIIPVTNPVGAQTEVSGLSTANVAGGVRIVGAVATTDLLDLPVDPSDITGPLPIALPTAVPGTASASLLLPLPGLPDDGLTMTALGGAAFRLIYDGLPGGNTGSGINGNLNLNLSFFDHIELTALAVVTGVPTEIPQIRLTLSDSVRTRSGLFVNVAEGVNILPMNINAFNLIDKTDIQQILIDIRGITTTSTFQLMHIEAVPEPSTALLVAVGLVGLAARRRSAR